MCCGLDLGDVACGPEQAGTVSHGLCKPCGVEEEKRFAADMGLTLEQFRAL